MGCLNKNAFVATLLPSPPNENHFVFCDNVNSAQVFERLCSSVSIPKMYQYTQVSLINSKHLKSIRGIYSCKFPACLGREIVQPK